MFDTWCTYSPVKNGPQEAEKKFMSGNHPQSGVTGETDLFIANCRTLRMAGVEIEPPQTAMFNGIEVNLEARIVWSPHWANSYAAACSRLKPGGHVKISQRSTLILDGDIYIEDLTLDGALVITAHLGSRVIVKRATVTNQGWALSPISSDCADEVARLRGFTIQRIEAREFVFKDSLEHIIDE